MEFVAPLIAIRLIITYLLWGLASYVNHFMDLSSENLFKQDYWNKGKGWVYKWKRDINGKLIPINKKPWYYLWFKVPKTAEKFPFSATLFVMFTDGWHLLKTIHNVLGKLAVCFISILGAYHCIAVFCVLTVCEWIGFYPYKLKKWK